MAVLGRIVLKWVEDRDLQSSVNHVYSKKSTLKKKGDTHG